MKFFEEVKTPAEYLLVDSPRKLSFVLNALKQAPFYAFDIETTFPTVKSKDVVRAYQAQVPILVAGISFAWGRTSSEAPWKPGKAAYIPLVTRDDAPYWRDRQDLVIASLKEVLETPNQPKVAHNAKFDVSELAKKLKIFVKCTTFDTMLAHAILDEDKLVSSHALKSDFDRMGKVVKKGVSDVYLKTEGSLFKEDLGEALTHYDPALRRYSKVPIDVLYPYACADSDMTLSLMFVFSQLLEAENLGWVFQNIVMPLQHAIMLLEMHGAPLNIPKARQVEYEQTQIMKRLEPIIHQLAGKSFLVSSTEQLGKVLYEDLQLPGGSRNKKGWIVDAEVLHGIEHPIVEPVLQYRRAQKISSTYATAALNLVEEVSDDGKVGWVHPSYYLDSATGRLKCSDPNLTNLPRSENGGDIVKGMWEGDEDYRFVFMDESQIELRVIAHESGEPSWLEGFHAGYDMHAAMAKLVWHLDCTVNEVKTLHKDKRSAAKAVNFGIAYGESVYSLAGKLGITFEEADKLVNEDYFGAAPVLKKWIDWVHAHAEAYGWVQNMFGRRRHLVDAQIEIPKGASWPDKSDRPSCYRQGVAPYLIGVDPSDLHNVSGDQLKQLIGVHKQTRHFKCSGCKHLRGCFINSEVKYLEGKKARAMRQAVNTIIQGGAADMTSLALVWITQELQRARLRSRPILYIHDEIGCYTHVDEIDAVSQIMEDCMTIRLQKFTNFKVPLLIDRAVVKCWGDKH